MKLTRKQFFCFTLILVLLFIILGAFTSKVNAATTVTSKDDFFTALRDPSISEIKLGTDITNDDLANDYTLVIKLGNRTLDLNGHTLRKAKTIGSDKGQGLWVQFAIDNRTFTIKDSVGNGKIISDTNLMFNFHNYRIVSNTQIETTGSKLIIQNGIFEHYISSATIFDKSGTNNITTTINGGTFIKERSSVFTDGFDLTINNMTLKGPEGDYREYISIISNLSSLLLKDVINLDTKEVWVGGEKQSFTAEELTTKKLSSIYLQAKNPYGIVIKDKSALSHTLTFDFNGGTRNEEGTFIISTELGGMELTQFSLIDSLGVTPPEGKELEAVLINEVRHELNTGIVIDKDITIKYIWKDIEKMSFTDIPEGSWYYESVQYVSNRGIITGYNETTFGPFDNLKREQLVNILWRIDGKPDASAYPNNFTDVPDGKWYTDAIKWANANGIVNGYGGTTLFGRGDNIIRQDLAIMLTNYAKYKGKYVAPTGTLDQFADKEKVSNYAVDALRWAAENSILSGNKNADGTRTIDPKNNARRCEAAVMLTRFCQNILNMD